MFRMSRFFRSFGLLVALILLVAGLSSVWAAPVRGDDASPPVRASAAQLSTPPWARVAPTPAASDLLRDGQPDKPAAKPAGPPAERPGPRPVLTPPAAAGILSPSATQQIINGDFEAGPGVGWNEYSTQGKCVICDNGYGSYYGELGGLDNEHAELHQSAIVPTYQPFLSFLYWIFSLEAGCMYDYASLYINYNPYMTIELCQPTETGGWVEQWVDLTNYVGQSVDIHFVATTDYSNISTWRIENVYFFANPYCYWLYSTHSGQGTNPVVNYAPQKACSPGYYSATGYSGEYVGVTASPAAGWKVSGWSGTIDNSSTSNTNYVDMPFDYHTVSVTYSAICYNLTRTHTGNGNDPTANPPNSPGCPSGQYTVGQSITMTAAPAAGWKVSSWTGTNNNGSTSTTNTVTMPASDHTVHVTYSAICYTLTRTHTGNGNDPTASPPNSPGCPSGQYTAGQSITVNASPAPGWKISGWTGTNNNGSTSTTNTVTMPANNHTVGVTYSAICYTLARTHTGTGSDPTASPPNSPGCPGNQYTAGQSITVNATAAAGWHVAGWTGTNNNNSTSTSNTVTMPADSHTVGVTYAVTPPTCHALTRTHTGQGGDPTANPTNSSGCPAGEYIVGQSIIVSASPADGWKVSGWSGTNNDTSTSASNIVSMPNEPRTVTVHYEQPACYPLTLSHEGQGGDPTAAPANSLGCPANRYHEGTAISLTAFPAAGWEVIGWQGTIDDSSHDASNFVFMPAGPHEVVAQYGQSAGLDIRLFLPSVVSIPSAGPVCHPGEQEINPNDTRDQALANGFFCFGKTYRGLPIDNLDTFAYNLTSTGSISAIVTDLRWGGGPAALVLSDKDGYPLLQDEASADRLSVTSGPLPPGYYFITIILHEPNVNETAEYSLRVETN